MAKQSTIGSGVVAAGRAVSAAKGGFLGDDFMSGYEKTVKSKEERESKNKAIQSKANDYISKFDSYVDLVDYSDAEKSMVKNTVVGYRNDFAGYANELARLEDKTSARAMELQDKMNDVRFNMQRLRDNLEGLANLKAEYAADFDSKVYSNSSKNTENILRANAILEGSISGINPDGSLNFDGYSVPITGVDGSIEYMKTDGFSYSTKDFKKPFKVAKEQAAQIIDLADKQSLAKGPMLDHVQKGIRLQVEEILSSDEALYSILSNSELQLIPLDSIDPDDPNARQKAVDLITQAIVDTRGTGLSEDSKGGKNTTGTSTTNKTNVLRSQVVNTVNEMRGIEKEMLSVGIGVKPSKPTKEFSFGPKDNPEQIRIKWDGEKNQWKYLNAKAGSFEYFDSLDELMNGNPTIFYQ